MVDVLTINRYATWQTTGAPLIDEGYKPPLVIVEAQTRDDAIIGQLEKYDVPVLVTVGADAKDPVKQLLATFDLIAQATGRTERAKTVTAEVTRFCRRIFSAARLR